MNASIIVRAYNAEATIARALTSALNQHFTGNYEVLVVNDGSADSTAKVARRFLADTRIRLIDQENKGIIAASNNGFESAKGDIVVLLDADDEALPTMLRDSTAPLLSDTRVDYSYPNYFEEYNGSRTLVVPQSPFNSIAGGMAWRRQKLLAEGGFSGQTIFPEYDLLLRTWGRWKGKHVSKPVMIYHRRAGSLTSDKERVRLSIQELCATYPERETEIRRIRSYGL